MPQPPMIRVTYLPDESPTINADELSGYVTRIFAGKIYECGPDFLRLARSFHGRIFSEL